MVERIGDVFLFIFGILLLLISFGGTGILVNISDGLIVPALVTRVFQI